MARVLSELLAEENRERSLEISLKAVRFNLKYRKADIMGRVHGGVFTNYSSTLGRFGGRRLSGRPSVTIPVSATSLLLATFGAAIQSIALGYETQDHIINAMITGRAEELPEGYRFASRMTGEQALDQEVAAGVKAGLYGVDALNDIAPGPVPIREFCQRQENVNLKGLCK